MAKVFLPFIVLLALLACGRKSTPTESPQPGSNNAQADAPDQSSGSPHSAADQSQPSQEAVAQQSVEGSSTHGGDGIKLIFARARPLATEMVRSFKASSGEGTIKIKEWISTHAQDLADDITNSEHVWTDALLNHDASTSLTRQAPIHLSSPLCHEAYNTAEFAAQLLIHESIHHFGVVDENFANEVTTNIFVSFRLRNPDNIGKALLTPFHLNPSDELGRTIGFTGSHAMLWSRDEANLLDTLTGTVKRIDATDKPNLANPTVTSDGTRFIIWGGRPLNNLHSFSNMGYAFDVTTNKWQTLNSVGAPSPRSGAFGFTTRTGFLIWGGSNNIATADANQFSFPSVTPLIDGGVYNSSSNTWTSITASPQCIRGAQIVDYTELQHAGQASGYLLVACTVSDDNGKHFQVAVYSVAERQWRTVPDMNVRKTRFRDSRDDAWSNRGDLYSFSAAWYNNQIAVLGTTEQGAKQSRLAFFDMEAWAWEERMYTNENTFAPSKGRYRIHQKGDRLLFFNGILGQFPLHEAKIGKSPSRLLGANDNWRLLDLEVGNIQFTQNTYFSICGWNGDAMVCVNPGSSGGYIIIP